MEFVMGNEKEIAIIPKGTSVRIMGCAYTLLEDVKVDGNQCILNETLKAQSEFEGKPKTNGCASYPKSTLSGKTGGAIGGSKDTKWML